MAEKIKQTKPTYAMSRHRRSSIIAAVVLLTAVGVWVSRSKVARTLLPETASEEQRRSYDFATYHGRAFTVVNVVDGDTLDIDIPDGEDNRTRIRLWGIDTPETKNPKTGEMYFGPEAAEFAEKLMLGKRVAVYLEKHRTRGYYGRLLAYVQLPDGKPNGKFLNEVLVSEGYAYADLRFRHSFYNKYKQLEASARRQNKGLWPNVTRDQLPEWLQEKNPKLLSVRTP